MAKSTSDQPLPPPPAGPVRLTPSVILATGLGAGFSPIMPGTVGSIWGVPLAWALGQIPTLLPGLGYGPALVLQAVAIVVLCLVGIPLCTAAGKQFGRKDPGAVVWDEIAAMPIVYFLVPHEKLSSPWVLLAGFVLFRIFDITKLPPIKKLEALPKGLGVMADDWLAAVYAAIVMQILLWAGLS